MKSHLLILSLAASLFTLSAMASACGGGDDELKQALESLGDNDLAIMVLSQEELGDEFSDLEVDDGSGFMDNEEAADDTADPDDTADDLERAGRVNGYDLTYLDPSFSALDVGEGVISVGTEVELFQDGSAASDFLNKQVDDFQRLEGEEIEAGVMLEEVETFAVDGLADEAVGLRQQVSFSDVEMFGTVVAFRLDRLVGAAVLSRADDADTNSQVEEIARALEGRIEGVLLGEITGTPVPIPEADEEEAALVPQEAVSVAQGFLEPFGLAGALQPLGDPADLSLTEGGPLEDLMLSSEDVPPGYQELFAGSSSFEIEPSFGEPSPGEVTMAMSMFADEGERHIIMSTVMQAEDEAVLQEALAEIRGLDFAEIEEAFSAFELFGIEVTNVRLVEAFGLGDGGFGFGYTIDFSALMQELGEEFGEEPLGEEAPEFSAMDMEMVMFMDGSLLGVVVTFALDDAAPASRPLAEIMAAKMAGAS